MKSKFITTAIFTTFLFSHSVFAQRVNNSSMVVAEYFGIWGDNWKKKFRLDTPLDKLNRLYIAFGKIVKTQDGHFSIAFDGSSDRVQALIAQTKKENPNAEIFLTVGGSDDSDSYGGAASDSKFATNVANFLSQNGFNGFDVDWESDLDQTNLNLLLKNLSAALHANGEKLTLDVWPYPNSAYDMTTISANVDQINIMSYGQYTSLSDCVTAYTSAGFPINKIIGGIETETGYSMGTDTTGPTGTIVQKSNFALTHGMAGMMAWRLDNDYATTDNPSFPTYQGGIALWNAMNPVQ